MPDEDISLSNTNVDKTYLHAVPMSSVGQSAGTISEVLSNK